MRIKIEYQHPEHAWDMFYVETDEVRSTLRDWSRFILNATGKLLIKDEGDIERIFPNSFNENCIWTLSESDENDS